MILINPALIAIPAGVVGIILIAILTRKKPSVSQTKIVVPPYKPILPAPPVKPPVVVKPVCPPVTAKPVEPVDKDTNKEKEPTKPVEPAKPAEPVKSPEVKENAPKGSETPATGKPEHGEDHKPEQNDKGGEAKDQPAAHEEKHEEKKD